jgi:transposase
MDKPKYFVGLDISSEIFDSAVYQENKPVIVSKDSFANIPEGFDLLDIWLSSQKINKDNCIICLEITGAYSENICYHLNEKGYTVCPEAPHKVHRAFYRQMKNDKVSAIQIAEYAYRFLDKLEPFAPNEVIVEQVKTLLATREQLVIQSTASKNALQSIKRKHFQTPLANSILTETIQHHKTAIEQIDKEIDKLIKNNSNFSTVIKALDSIPGIGMLFIANFFSVTNGLSKNMNYKQLASYIGICPHECTSGSSVYKKPKSSGFGPSRLRKLLFLAAMSVRQHNPEFYNYFVSKQAQGKNDKLVINNIANKLLKLVCAISKNGKEFVKNYKSVHPKFLKQYA